jgi:two-component system, OmpR family, sensor histidine kinase VicK
MTNISPDVSFAQIKEQSGEHAVQSTTILSGAENIINFILPRYPTIKENIDICYDYLGPSVLVETKPIWRETLKLNKRGIKVRLLTDIRKDNLSYCKQFLALENLQLRHLDGVKGNFGIADKRDYFAHASKKEGGPVTHAIHSTVEGIVQAQQYLFDNLWKEGIPAEARLREIEEGVLPDTIEALKESTEIIRLAYKLVKSAKDEILIIFHTANAIFRHKRAGGIDLLVENVVKNKTRVKILVPIEDKIKDTIYMLERINGVEIRNIETPMQTRMTILVVDRTHSLVVELKDDTKDDLEEAIGLATYSNSKSTVLSYVSIFETLWKQSELRAELINLSMAQREFINIAAHELRNPIQPILGLSDILQHPNSSLKGDRKNKARQKKEMIDVIARNAKRLQRLTEDILDVTRIEGKTLKLNKQSFILPQIIGEIVQDYATEIKNSNRNILLSYSTPKELKSTLIDADQNRIKQVVFNLIDNAIKFTNEGTINITTKPDSKHNRIVVSVSDTGIGIDSNILPKLFTKFVTKSDKGTGLGLYICKGIIEAHGGKIWAENNSDDDGCGATITFTLPLS